MFREADTSERPSAIEAFRKLYYHLYSNSNSSRAERLFEDIAKILLIKLLAERDRTCDIERFVSGTLSANGELLGILNKAFPDLISEQDTFTVSDDLLRQGLQDLANIRLLESPATVLGDAFQALIGPRMRGEKGQFFTPRSLVRAMVNVAQPQPSDKVLDPAAGTGGFLVEVHSHRKELFPDAREFGPLVGLEKDRDVQRLGGAMVTAATDGIGTIRLANSLDMDALRRNGNAVALAPDIILTNPPFGARIGITDKATLSQFCLGHGWAYSASDNKWYKHNSIRVSQDPQILFLELCLTLLKPGGLCGIVLPEGVYGNRQTGYVWDYVRSVGTIEAMLDCPRTTFQPSTDTKTNVVFIRKHPAKGTAPNSVFIAVAKSCGHDRRGRTVKANGEAVADDFAAIGSSYVRQDNDYWTECDLSDPYYLVPRFYNHHARRAAEREAAEWGGQLISIADLVKSRALTIRKGHEVGAEAYGTGDVPFVRTSDISNLEVSVNPTNGVSEEVYERYRKMQHLGPGDILLVVDGRYKIGRTAILHAHNCQCVVQSHLRVLTVTNKSPLDCYELLYVLNQPAVLEEMRNLVFIQSTLGSIGKRLDQLMLPIPKKTDEWKNRIQEFRQVLEARARLLEDVRRFQSPEPEL